MNNTPPNYCGPFCYTLHLKDHADGDSARKVGEMWKGGLVINNMDKEVCQSRCPKIYVVRKGRDVLYVGYADQQMASRLRYGLNPKLKRAITDMDGSTLRKWSCWCGCLILFRRGLRKERLSIPDTSA